MTTQDITISENLKMGSNKIVVESKNMVVNDNPSNEAATTFLKALKRFQGEIKSELRPHIDQANTLHKSLVSQEKRLLDPLQQAERAIKSKVGKFLEDQERIRQEEQRKVQAKADKEERERKEELERQARAHEEAGRTEKAEERRQQAEEHFVPAPIIDSKVEKQSGVSSTRKWMFEVTKLELLPPEYLMADDKAIGQVVRALKDKDKAERVIPGIRVYSEASVSVRT